VNGVDYIPDLTVGQKGTHREAEALTVDLFPDRKRTDGVADVHMCSLPVRRNRILN
jgi:hypothetical protein